MSSPYPPLEPQRPPGYVEPTVHEGRDTFQTEYVADAGYVWGSVQVLGATADDIALVVDEYLFAEVGRDPKCHKAKRILITGTLTDDLQFAPGATEEEVKDKNTYRLFAQVMDLAKRAIDGLHRPVWQTLEEMMNQGFDQGHAIAETIWEERVDEPLRETPDLRRSKTGTTRSMSFLGRLFGASEPAEAPEKSPGPARQTKILDRPKVRLMPREIKVKPHGAALFVIDIFFTTLGLVPAWRQGRTSFNVQDVITRDKFLVFTVHPRHNDPRGTSLWWPILTWYSLMKKIPLNFAKYLSQEAIPIPILTLPANMSPTAQGWYGAGDPVRPDILATDPQAAVKMLTAVQSGLQVVRNMYNGQGVVVPDGTKIAPYQSGASKANVFPLAIDAIGEKIEEAILMQVLAQSTANKGQSKSASQTQEGRLTDQFFWWKRVCAVMLMYDLIAIVIRVNLGQWALAYMPLLSLGDSVKRDWANDLKVVAQAYFWGFIDDTMRRELCAWLGLPTPGASRFELGMETGAVPDVNGNPVANNQQRPDKQPGQKGRNDGNSTPKKTEAEMQAWLDENWPDGVGRTFNNRDEAITFLEELRNNVISASPATRVPTMGHTTHSRGSYVGYSPGTSGR
jgi:hypothetical protein